MAFASPRGPSSPRWSQSSGNILAWGGNPSHSPRASPRPMPQHMDAPGAGASSTMLKKHTYLYEPTARRQLSSPRLGGSTSSGAGWQGAGASTHLVHRKVETFSPHGHQRIRSVSSANTGAAGGRSPLHPGMQPPYRVLAMTSDSTPTLPHRVASP